MATGPHPPPAHHGNGHLPVPMWLVKSIGVVALAYFGTGGLKNVRETVAPASESANTTANTANANVAVNSEAIRQHQERIHALEDRNKQQDQEIMILRQKVAKLEGKP